jgi:hypothetical protein
MKKQIALLLLTICTGMNAVPFVNAIRPYDINFQPLYWQHQEKQFSIMTAYGVSGKARNADGDKVSEPQYLHADQNALAMLKGAVTTSEAANIAQQINVNGDNGVRGHYVVTGDFQVPLNFVCAGHYHFLGEWTLNAYLPLYRMTFKNIVWENQTKNVTGDDALTRSLLTDDFFTNVTRLGDNLNLQEWGKTGVGDLTVSLSWMRRFLQHKEWLKEVRVNTRMGLSLPTGVKKDEDKAFSLAFGNDGAFGLPFGAGLDLRFKNLCWVGVDIGFEHIFSHTKERRIMTDAAQTNYLFLQKANARKEYGFTQMFNLYVEPELYKGLSLRLSYQHTKQSDAKLFTISEDFSSIIASKAADLKEWTTHHALIQLKWDRVKVDANARLLPQISIFGQVPFNGRSSLQTASVGMSIAFGF